MKRGHAGFTLFEVILAIALAAVLLTLIGTAINLYLVQVDSGRTRVEEAQLARSVLSMIAADIHATSVYKPQDTSAIAQLMAATAKYDVDKIDEAAAKSGGVGKASAIASASGGAGALGSLSAMSSASSSTAASASASGTDSADTDTTLALGINGSVDDGLYVDATRLPRQEEIFSTTTGYTNAQSPNSNGGSAPGTQSASGGGSSLASDLKTIHYFVRPGDSAEVGSASVTSLDPAAQARLGGLVRQEIPRAMRNFAEKNGGSDVLESNTVLLAPEVVKMELHYFNGTDIADTWDMRELKTLPTAVEVRIWVRSPAAAAEPVTSTYDMAKLNETTHMYRQVVYLPMAQVANAAQSATSSTDSSSTTDPSTENSTSSGTDSVFNSE